jgi:hypothetical protein
MNNRPTLLKFLEHIISEALKSPKNLRQCGKNPYEGRQQKDILS